MTLKYLIVCVHVKLRLVLTFFIQNLALNYVTLNMEDVHSHVHIFKIYFMKTAKHNYKIYAQQNDRLIILL